MFPQGSVRDKGVLWRYPSGLKDSSEEFREKVGESHPCSLLVGKNTFGCELCKILFEGLIMGNVLYNVHGVVKV